MKMRDVQRGYRLLSPNGTVLGEVTSPAQQRADGSWAYTYVGLTSDGQWTGHFYWGPPASNPEWEAYWTVADVPSPPDRQAYDGPPVYYDPAGNRVGFGESAREYLHMEYESENYNYGRKTRFDQ